MTKHKVSAECLFDNMKSAKKEVDYMSPELCKKRQDHWQKAFAEHDNRIREQKLTALMPTKKA